MKFLTTYYNLTMRPIASSKFIYSNANNINTLKTLWLTAENVEKTSNDFIALQWLHRTKKKPLAARVIAPYTGKDPVKKEESKRVCLTVQLRSKIKISKAFNRWKRYFLKNNKSVFIENKKYYKYRNVRIMKNYVKIKANCYQQRKMERFLPINLTSNAINISISLSINKGTYFSRCFLVHLLKVMKTEF